jgi:hypothetical protein
MLARSYASRPLRLLALLVSLLCALSAQEDPTIPDDVPALSLQRLSVSAASAFFYAPWKELNDSFGAVRDAYAYNAPIGLDHGRIDRLRGDVSVGIDLQYRVVGPISLIVEGTTTFTGADMSLQTRPVSHVDHAFYYIPYVATQFNNSFDLRLTGIGAGLAVGLPGVLRSRIRLTAGRSSASLDYAFSSVNSSEISRFNANLTDHTTYISVGLESSIPIAGSFSLCFGVHYRSLRFAGLKGDGTVFRDYPGFPGSEYSSPFKARLVNAGSYFGIDISGDGRAVQAGRELMIPWLATPGTSIYQLSVDPTPATLYLDGFGARGGLTYAF